MSGSLTGRPIPNPAMRGVAPGLGRRVHERARRACLREVRGDLRIRQRQVRSRADVRTERIGQVVERQRTADDRDRVARLEPRLAIVPAAAPSRGADVGRGRMKSSVGGILSSRAI